jgi:hypothetical protein
LHFQTPLCFAIHITTLIKLIVLTLDKNTHQQQTNTSPQQSADKTQRNTSAGKSGKADGDSTQLTTLEEKIVKEKQRVTGFLSEVLTDQQY